MDAESRKIKTSLAISLSVVVILWLIKLVEFTLNYDFARFGILPRHAEGVIGIITGPLIHGNFSHLASNTLPLLILVIGLFYFYNKIALEVIIWIYFMTGFWVWIAARSAYHIGASGIVYGLVSFLFFSGVFRRDTSSIAVSLIVVFLYGGMFYGILPISENISWESHILGAVAGIFCAFYFRQKTPIPQFKWESDEDEVSSEFTGNSLDTNYTYELYKNYSYTYTFDYEVVEKAEEINPEKDNLNQF